MKTLIIVVVGFLLALLAVPTSAQRGPVSADGARVPPLTTVIDALGGSWTLAPGTGSRAVLRNGVDTAGRASVILIWQGSAYVLGDGGLIWWKYTGVVGNAWENKGAVDPSTIAYPPVTPATTANPPDTPAAVRQRLIDAARAEADALLVRVAALQKQIQALQAP